MTIQPTPNGQLAKKNPFTRTYGRYAHIPRHPAHKRLRGMMSAAAYPNDEASTETAPQCEGISDRYKGGLARPKTKN